MRIYGNSFILYMTYFPLHLRYCRTLPLPPSIESHLRDPSPTHPNNNNNNNNIYAGSGAVYEGEGEETPLLRNGNGPEYGAGAGDNERKRVKLEWTGEWRLAVILAVVVAIHLTLLSLLAIVLLTYLPSPTPTSPSPPLHPLLSLYARFLGASSALLTFLQYAPQIIRTYRLKIVGALSIKMMCVQVPGSVVFVLSLVGREGVEWSAWLTYAFAGSMQAVLLVMCIVWRGRQRRLGQDDFGNPLPREGEIEEHPRA